MTVVTDKKGSPGEVPVVGQAQDRCGDAASAVRTSITVGGELRVEAHCLAAWREEFTAAVAEGLKARPTDPSDCKLREASARSASSPWSWSSGWRRGEKGAPDPAQETAEVSVETGVALARVCRILHAPHPRSTRSPAGRPRLGASADHARSLQTAGCWP
jgi:hypothetical protein